MANKFRYLLPADDVLDDATVYVSSATSGLPAVNVQNAHIRKTYRTTGKANEFLRFAASGGATTMNCLFVGNTNLSKTATVYLQGNTTSNFTTVALQVQIGVATDARGAALSKLSWWSSTAHDYAFWRLYVSDTGNASSCLSFGRIMGGRYVEPARNIREGFVLRTVDPSRQRATAGRMGYSTTRRRYDELTYSMAYMDGAGEDLMRGIFNEVGKFDPFVISLDPETRPHHHTWYVQFTTDLERQHAVADQWNQQDVVFQEKN